MPWRGGETSMAHQELAEWVELARQHWKDFQPRRYRALKKAGTLE
jgi:hypothetical protein